MNELLRYRKRHLPGCNLAVQVEQVTCGCRLACDSGTAARMPPRAEWQGRQCGEICRDAGHAAQHWATRPWSRTCYQYQYQYQYQYSSWPANLSLLTSYPLGCCPVRVWCAADQLVLGRAGRPTCAALLPAFRSGSHSQSAASRQTARPGQRSLQGFRPPVPHWLQS